MSSVEWLSSMPALCEVCNAVTAVNLRDPTARCPECTGEVVPYNDPSLKHPEDRGKPTPRGFFQSDFDERHRYRCPMCGEATLLFSTYLNVD